MSSTMDRVEVFSGIQRRRRYTFEQQLSVLAKASEPGMTISHVGRRHRDLTIPILGHGLFHSTTDRRSAAVDRSLVAYLALTHLVGPGRDRFRASHAASERRSPSRGRYGLKSRCELKQFWLAECGPEI